MEVVKKQKIVLYDVLKCKEALIKLTVVSNIQNWQIVEYLIENPGKSNTELYIKFRSHQTDMSRRLTDLQRSGWVVKERIGKEVLHYPNVEEIERCKPIINKMAKLWK